jgi:hypothetical protein
MKDRHLQVHAIGLQLENWLLDLIFAGYGSVMLARCHAVFKS